MTTTFSRRAALGGLGASLLATPAARAQTGDWPNRSVKFVCGYPPGGSTDAFTRAYGDYLAQHYKQPFVVENKTSAGSIIACEIVARAAPDGYTFLFTNSTALFANKVTYKKLPYDPDKDLVPVSLMPAGHLPMYVHKSVPAKTIPEFVAWAKTTKVNFGTYGAGSVAHITCATFNNVHGLSMQPVHYRGEGPMWADINGGVVHAAVGSYQAASAAMQAGNAIPIAVPTTTRMKRKLLHVPTFHEQGATHPYFLLQGLVGCLAPAGTPRPIVEAVSNLMVEAGKTPRIQALLEQFGIDDAAQDWREFERYFREDGPLLVKAVKELGLDPI